MKPAIQFQIVLFIALACVMNVARAADPVVSIRIEPMSKEYLLGQRVELLMTITNVSNEAITLWKLVEQSFDVQCEPEAKRFISFDGEEFEEYATGIYHTDCSITRSLVTLEPRQSTFARLHFVYIRDGRRFGTDGGGWLFHGEGKRWLKVRCPIVVCPIGHDPERIEVESNTTAIRIQEPVADEALVFEQLLDPNIAYFLQSSLVPDGAGDVPRHAAKVLKLHPDSVYADALWEALALYYHRVPRPKDARERALIREALGIEEEVEIGLIKNKFLSDGWLDVRRVTFDFAEGKRLDEALENISRQAAISLRSAPDVWTGTIRATKRTVTVRQFMQSLVDPGRTMWVREDDGYVLSPVPGIEQKPDK